jgi:hypothetical protein
MMAKIRKKMKKMVKKVESSQAQGKNIKQRDGLLKIKS